jgi:hypothetical protein
MGEKDMSRAELENLQLTEPDRLDAAADNWTAEYRQPGCRNAAILVERVAKARQTAANLRAMRAAHLRLNYSQSK